MPEIKFDTRIAQQSTHCSKWKERHIGKLIILAFVKLIMKSIQCDEIHPLRFIHFIITFAICTFSWSNSNHRNIVSSKIKDPTEKNQYKWNEYSIDETTQFDCKWNATTFASQLWEENSKYSAEQLRIGNSLHWENCPFPFVEYIFNLTKFVL